MDAARFRRVEALFHDARELPPPQRRAFLLSTCDDPALRAEVLSLLDGEADPEPGPATGALADAAGHAVDAAPAPQHGRIVGVWRLLEPLGSGGMGQVFAAERSDGAYRTRAALKMLNPWLRGGAFEERFARERQILSDLRHPAIAALIDGGVADDGTPFLVMELIDGVPITRHADERALGIEARLALFVEVCRAVQYAHQNLVIHRDLKPGNILVDAEGRPKLLDFGIAKLMLAEPAAADSDAPQTQIWTPEYASPEQVRAQPITTASDVYSLGVILYQLLAGRRPRFDVDRPAQPPTRPSALTDDAPPVAFRRRLAGDLDTVVLKALAFEPERRYATAQQLCDDIERFLRHEPVQARPDSLGYRAAKFVRRHRWGVAFASLALVGILGATVAIARLALNLRVERDRSTVAQAQAEREARTAQQVADFLARLFDGANPNSATGAPPTLRDVLDRGAQDVQSQLGDSPEVQARLLVLMADAYRQLGEFGRGIEVAERALALRRAAPDTEPAVLATAIDSLGELRRSHGDFAVAEVLHREALALRRAQSPQDPVLVGRSLNNLALTLSESGRGPEAIALYEQSLALRRQVLGEDAAPVLSTLVNIGLLKRASGDVAGAEAAFRTVYDARLKTLGEKHVATANVMTHLGRTLLVRGDASGAEPLLRRALAVRRELLGANSADVSIGLYELAGLLIYQDRLAEAEAALREAAAIDRATFGPDNAESTFVGVRLGTVLQARGQLAQAETMLRESARIVRAALPPDHPRVASTSSALADVLRERGQLVEADALFREALAIQRAKLRPDDPELGRTLIGLTAIAARRGDLAAARAFADEASRIVERAPALFDAQRRQLAALRASITAPPRSHP
jgi:tetratricopeptide (TPR) repeat protein